MMHLIITVMAIALAALLTVGGIHYFDGGSGTRILVSRSFETQLDAISIAVSAYKASNNGMTPPTSAETVESDPRIKGFLPWGKLPPQPKAAEGFRWTRVDVGGKPSVCLSNPAPTDRYARDAAVRFASNQIARRGQQRDAFVDVLDVVLAENCVPGPFPERTTFDQLINQAQSWSSIAVIIRER